MAIGELFRHWTYQVFAPGTLLRRKYNAFRELLRHDSRSLELIAELEDIHYGNEKVDWSRVIELADQLDDAVRAMLGQLMEMNPARYMGLADYCNKIAFYMRMAVSVPEPDLAPPYVIPLAEAHQHPDRAGGKAARLATVRSQTMLPVPDATVITAAAYHYFIEHNELREPIDARLRRLRLSRPDELAAISEELRAMIMEADLPPRLEEDILTAAYAMSPQRAPLAVRSSAVAEDGPVSFAGQYASVLGVEPGHAGTAWKRVVASKYQPRALSYRILHGLADAETPMAALLMPMLDAACAGVIYTRDPDPPRRLPAEELAEGVTAVHAVAGTGDVLVSGDKAAQSAWLSRRPRSRILERPVQGVPTVEQPMPTVPLLTTEDMKRLARYGRELENLFGEPQDVEWVLDTAGRIFIVQSRPVPGGTAHGVVPERTAGASDGAQGADGSAPVPAASHDALPVLAEGSEPVSAGVGSGTARHAAICCEIGDMPQGTVLVTTTLGPSLTRIIDRLEAVVAQTGSRACHFASVAREFGLPVVTGIADPFTAIADGSVVTVDGGTGRIHAGRPAPDKGAETSAPPRARRRAAAAARERRGGMRRLARAMQHIAKLNLTDPASSDFSPENCRSMHDLVRFAHERGVAEMFSLVGRGGRGLGGAKKLRTDVPMIMYVLNIEDGLFPTAAGKEEIGPDDFRSTPMWALWFGLSAARELWANMPPAADWNELDRISAGIFRRDAPQLASYAVISAHYAHLMMRFGYHFALVDTLCAPEDRTNYIQFRFKGGGAAAEGRELRIRVLERVLARQGFAVKTRGDLLDARHGPDAEAVIQKRLAMLGMLLAETRLLDVRIGDADEAEAMADDFLARLDTAGGGAP
ncbi:pyruvate, phosphate dikinase [Nitratidesulfovibrio sp. HK-II]|uniref:PEP/pyruvate-binding domain-containing protein n=1 Tax=Nitratidesulfovibrio sp. HK-II TaxID=2009266 RepID=UPI000E2E9A62|nr:PEP/pyruvate-binding domain-containing protein [Nitratidesulfovibrio sp. HK-II]GBO97315.1 PEP/pyruvate binding domain protein [Nitratidesulfovibrio sp. HK-II]